jgi:peptidoglycan/LPS O-acetylase OafA/YrhL
MVEKKHFKKILGWLPKNPNQQNKLTFNVEEKKFQFNKHFYVSLAISYALFVLLVVVPFLLGYLDSTLLGYGLAGIAYSLCLMVMVYLLNRRPELRIRIAYVAVGAWLGLAVGVVGGMLLFGHQIIAAIGSLGLALLMLIVLPVAGGLIGYCLQKRKFATTPFRSFRED